MFSIPQRSKRDRSPSPLLTPELASPLDVLVKRRRRDSPSDSYFPNQCHRSIHAPPAGDPYHQYQEPEEGAQEVSSRGWLRSVGVERKRTRQWESKNAPPPPAFPSTSQPVRAASFDSSSPRRSYSQPEQARCVQMSSSPIRHYPPSSSPFRGSSGPRLDDMDPEEMRREWGEEYASQNSLLHSLHVARQASQTATPDSTLLATPALPTSYRSLIPSSSSTQLHLGSTPYRTTSMPMSSPFSSCAVRYDDSPSVVRMMDEEEGMETLDDGGRHEMAQRYEEANRLLAELEVDRRRRWGAVDHEDADQSW